MAKIYIYTCMCTFIISRCISSYPINWLFPQLCELIFYEAISHSRTSPSKEFLHNWCWPWQGNESFASFYHPEDLKRWKHISGRWYSGIVVVLVAGQQYFPQQFVMWQTLLLSILLRLFKLYIFLCGLNLLKQLHSFHFPT